METDWKPLPCKLLTLVLLGGGGGKGIDECSLLYQNINYSVFIYLLLFFALS